MRRRYWYTAMTSVMGLALLAGCTTQLSGLSSADETARYLQNARGRYLAPGPGGDPWGPYIREASNRFDVPETWIRALMRQESGGSLYRNGRLITSSAGAMGLMQVMPGTYRELRSRHNLGADPFEPHDNIMAGVAYMREMYDMYGAPGFLAAYNAGPNRLDDYLANTRGLPDETRRYVASIGPSLRYAAPKVASPAEQFAMNHVPLHIPAGPRFGYGTAMPFRVASAAPVTYAAPVAYAAPVFTPAPVPAQRTLAWAEPPRQALVAAQAPRPAVFAPAQVAQAPRPVVVAMATPVPQPRPVAQTFAAPAPRVEPQAPRRVAMARAEPREAPRVRTFAQIAPQRVAVAVPPAPPGQRAGGFHFISSAVAAEIYPTRRGHHHASAASAGRGGHAVRAVSAGPVPAMGAKGGCRKNSHGKVVCI